uniref:Uncharacterized protein n=1 Tax=Sarcophilus harrisii TaxID=9305 RepID=A0A7N4NJW2_SARHA
MQLPPGLEVRLGPAPAGSPSESLPLPVLRHPAAGAAPFRFAPRTQRLPRGHPLFEDGDVQRHAYLQEVITQVCQVPERPPRGDLRLPRGRLPAGVRQPGGLRAPLPHAAHARVLRVPARLPLGAPAGRARPRVARLALPAAGRAAEHAPVPGGGLPGHVPQRRRAQGAPGARAPLPARLPLRPAPQAPGARPAARRRGGHGGGARRGRPARPDPPHPRHHLLRPRRRAGLQEHEEKERAALSRRAPQPAPGARGGPFVCRGRPRLSLGSP